MLLPFAHDLGFRRASAACRSHCTGRKGIQRQRRRLHQVID